MTTSRNLAFVSVILLLLPAVQALAENITLDDGTSCAVIEGSAQRNDTMSTTVTAGNGQVSSSTTDAGRTTINPSASASSSTSSAGSGSVDSFSTASIARPDGSVVTKRSDGTCSITKPRQ